MKLTQEQTALIQRLYDERITQAEKVALSEVSTTIVFNEVFPLVITKAAAYLDNGYILNPQACNHYQSSPFFRGEHVLNRRFCWYRNAEGGCSGGI